MDTYGTLSEAHKPAPGEFSTHEAEVADLSDVTPELRALLAAYVDALNTLNDAPAVSLVRLRHSRLPNWLAFPAPRRAVSAFFVRYVYRCVDALKSAAIRRDVASEEAGGKDGDIEMLARFRDSLPTKPRLALFVPFGLVGVLAVAYGMAFVCHAGYRSLFGDLATSAISLNRVAAIAAFQSAYRLAVLQHPLEAYFFAGAAMFVAWSALVVVVLLLPAFHATRQLESALAQLENRAFGALGARAVHQIELDLVVRLLLMAAVALLGIAALTPFWQTKKTEPLSLLIGASCVALTILAGLELRARYLERRSGTAGCRGLATKAAFALVAAASAALFVSLPFLEQKSNRETITWKREIANSTNHGDEAVRGWLTNQLTFMVTDIRRNAQCAEPHDLLIDDPQYLQINLEVWSDVDQFANPTTANALNLSHWSVQDSAGKSTRNLYMHTKCGRGGDALTQPIVPGAHSSTQIVVSAPKDAAVLQLDIPSYRGVWQWPIPSAADTTQTH